jgi:uncharacterized circularly permuted ATP-grasp superfamily protein/uncharacterized alpha-E superfamily protein
MSVTSTSVPAEPASGGDVSLSSQSQTQGSGVVPAIYDEWSSADASVRTVCEKLQETIGSMAQGTLGRMTRAAQDLMRDQGITFHISEERSDRERILPFDLLPLAISSAEWAGIEKGLADRARTWNSFLRDIYSTQEILKAGIVPYEVVYSDPHYRRECVGVRLAQDIHLHVSAYDLIRDESGRWVVMEDQISNPTGAGYALQNRRILSQVCPQFMEGAPVSPIYQYPAQLLETLQASAPQSGVGARVVLLSPGIYNEAYYEHAALARQMAVPLVQPGDLIVLDSEVYLKTISGLDRVDVIYRRIDGSYVDPVTQGSSDGFGIPGLLSCLRRGTVSVANALGSGLGDNRALAAYLPQMMEYYHSVKPSLETVPILNFRDIDMREYVFDNWRKYVIKTLSTRGPTSVWLCEHLNDSQWDSLRQRIEEHPEKYVAQPLVRFSTTPTWTSEEGIRPRHVSVRAFALNSPGGVHISPCALTRMALREGSLIVASTSGGGSKDTWILRGNKRGEEERENGTFLVRARQHRLRVGSRTADSLFWIGRYAERAEATLRILSVVQQIRIEDNLNDNPKAWYPLWEAMAAATGHPTSFFKKSAFHKEKTTTLANYILLDPENFASVFSCLRACRQNAQQIREALPPEVWTVINRLHLQLDILVRERHTPRIESKLAEMTLHSEVMTMLDELSGSVEKHMVRDDAWNFWRVGRYMEASLFTLLTMKQVFIKRNDERQAGSTLTEDINLDALLRMLAGQYAYRSYYKSRPVASQVAVLLLQDEHFPRSLYFSIQQIVRALRDTFGDRPSPLAETPIRYASQLASELTYADISQYFSPMQEDTLVGVPGAVPRARIKPFGDWLDALADRVLQFNNLIADHYLNHQASTPPNAERY